MSINTVDMISKCIIIKYYNPWRPKGFYSREIFVRKCTPYLRCYIRTQKKDFWTCAFTWFWSNIWFHFGVFFVGAVLSPINSSPSFKNWTKTFYTDMVSCIIYNRIISVHLSVVADLRIPTNHSRTVPQIIIHRKLKTINTEASKADIKRRLTLKPLKLISKILKWSDILKPTKLNWLNNMTVRHTLINLHAPLVTKKISPEPPSLGF